MANTFTYEKVTDLQQWGVNNLNIGVLDKDYYIKSNSSNPTIFVKNIIYDGINGTSNIFCKFVVSFGSFWESNVPDYQYFRPGTDLTFPNDIPLFNDDKVSCIFIPSGTPVSLSILWGDQQVSFKNISVYISQDYINSCFETITPSVPYFPPSFTGMETPSVPYFPPSSTGMEIPSVPYFPPPSVPYFPQSFTGVETPSVPSTGMEIPSVPYFPPPSVPYFPPSFTGMETPQPPYFPPSFTGMETPPSVPYFPPYENETPQPPYFPQSFTGMMETPPAVHYFPPYENETPQPPYFPPSFTGMETPPAVPYFPPSFTGMETPPTVPYFPPSFTGMETPPAVPYFPPSFTGMETPPAPPEIINIKSGGGDVTQSPYKIPIINPTISGNITFFTPEKINQIGIASFIFALFVLFIFFI